MITSINEYFDNKNTNIICYHRSNNYDHMENNELSIDNADDFALFGKAIYFSQSPDISQQLGKYICKFSINLEEPCLDLNKNITVDEAKEILKKFNKKYNTKLDLFWEDIEQFGDIFDQINEDTNWDFTKYYKDFFTSLGYNSFKYFCNYHTDFINNKGDYGLCYGVYNDNDIKFIDGPF
jgi:hypothetical protein